jgi:hypothetical protein
MQVGTAVFFCRCAVSHAPFLRLPATPESRLLTLTSGQVVSAENHDRSLVARSVETVSFGLIAGYRLVTYQQVAIRLPRAGSSDRRWHRRCGRS